MIAAQSSREKSHPLLVSMNPIKLDQLKSSLQVLQVLMQQRPNLLPGSCKCFLFATCRF